MKKIFLVLIMLISLSITAQTSNPFGFDCVITGDPQEVSSPVLPGGVYKPASVVGYTSETGAYFPVLIVYVQFTDDPGDNVTYWPRNQAPEYFGEVIATSKSTDYGTEWWNAYVEDTKILSDYWMEVSRGTLHLVGQEINVVLPHTVSWYESNGN